MARGFEKISYEFFKEEFKGGDYSELKYEDILIPKRGTNKSAGYDFISLVDFTLKVGERRNIPTGIKVYMQEDEYLAVHSRSSAGFKHNVRLCNQVGIIDADYYSNPNNDGHILLALKNEGDHDWAVKKGDKIVQGIFNKYLVSDMEEENKIDRIGGIGSTDRE